MFKSNSNPVFRTKLAEDIFLQKYAHEGCETWERLASTVVDDVCPPDLVGPMMTPSDRKHLKYIISQQLFIPGGRYLYYAGRGVKFFNNCYLLRSEEDTREDWAMTAWKAESCLTTGGGIGNDYSIYRPEGSFLSRTGGVASGPLPKMNSINEQGRAVMQGAGRRSAIYASLLYSHGDAKKFLKAKNWFDMPIPGTDLTYADMKNLDFNFPAPLDMTNISLNYNTEWLLNYLETAEYGDTFYENTYQAMRTGEPGFSFNFFGKENETLRNACTEVTSEDDSDVCNLGSINIARITDKKELAAVVELATKFLIAGTLRAELPYPKIKEVREKNRRLGLGLMGIHEWLIQRNQKYEVTEDLKEWLQIYEGVSDYVSKRSADVLGISRPVANRAIAPTGTIGMLASTTTSGEPIYAVAYKRRYLSNGRNWKYQYAVDSAAQNLIDFYGVRPETIETAISLAETPERRIKFQYDLQKYVDMGISSTINLPAWGSKHNNEDKVPEMANLIAKYAHGLRGITCYPNGSRGGQPITQVEYKEAVDKLGTEFSEHLENNDICEISGHGGSCGV